MIQENILKQLEVIYNLFITNKNFLLISIIALGLLLVLIICNHLSNKKIFKIISLILYLGVFGILIYFFHDQILNFLDYLMNNIFIFLFFPNLAIYTLVLIIINIIIIRNLFKKNNVIIKNINSIFFILFNIIFYLIIDNIIKNKIDIYEQLSIYTNKNLLYLIQISMYLFIIWLVILLINNISTRLVKNVKVKEKVKVKRYVPEPITVTYEPKELEDKKLSKIPEVTPNTLIISEQEVNDIKLETEKLEEKSSIYNSYIDIVPIKKKRNSLENMDNLFIKEENKDMDLVFGNKTYLNTIMSDIEKLRNNQHDSNQIKKIYESISLNSKELTLDDYNYLIKVLKEIKNNN